jgi:hypothetical protein
LRTTFLGSRAFAAAAIAILFAGCSGGGSIAPSASPTLQQPQTMNVGGHVELITQISANSYNIAVDGKLAVTNVFNADGSITQIWQNVSLNGKTITTSHTSTVPSKNKSSARTDAQIKEPCSIPYSYVQAVNSAQAAYNSAIATDIGLGIASIATDAETFGLGEALGLGVAQYAAVENTVSAYDNLQNARATLAAVQQSSCGG